MYRVNICTETDLTPSLFLFLFIDFNKYVYVFFEHACAIYKSDVRGLIIQSKLVHIYTKYNRNIILKVCKIPI